MERERISAQGLEVTGAKLQTEKLLVLFGLLTLEKDQQFLSSGNLVHALTDHCMLQGNSLSHRVK